LRRLQGIYLFLQFRNPLSLRVDHCTIPLHLQFNRAETHRKRRVLAARD
jgi:hypothetical protein